MYQFKDEDGIITLTGERLKFYYDEHNEFPKEYGMELNKVDIEKVIKKLKRHYKVDFDVLFNSKKNGHAFVMMYRPTINIPPKTSLGMVCHEIAHIIHWTKYHGRRHNKKLYRIMKRLILYCRKKNYFNIKDMRGERIPVSTPLGTVLFEKLGDEKWNVVSVEEI